MFNISIGANIVDPEEQSDLGPHCLSMRVKLLEWTTKIYIL